MFRGRLLGSEPVWFYRNVFTLVGPCSGASRSECKNPRSKHETSSRIIYYFRKDIYLWRYIGRQLVCHLNPLHLDRFQACSLGKDERLCGKRVLLFFERKYVARESCATGLDVGGCTISIHTRVAALHASGSHSKEHTFHVEHEHVFTYSSTYIEWHLRVDLRPSRFPTDLRSSQGSDTRLVAFPAGFLQINGISLRGTSLLLDGSSIEL